MNSVDKKYIIIGYFTVTLQSSSGRHCRSKMELLLYFLTQSSCLSRACQVVSTVERDQFMITHEQHCEHAERIEPYQILYSREV